MKNRIWREKAELYWCRNCNIPLLTPKCEICNEIGRRLNATPPIDVRPAFQEDIRRITEAILWEFKDENAVKTLIERDKVVLLNKIPHIDQADEIIIDGRVIGQIYFNPRIGVWRFKPVEEGSSRLIANSSGYWCTIKRRKIEKWERISLLEVINGEIPEESGRIIAIGTPEGKSIGVGEYEGNQIKVIKAWEPHSTHIIRVKSNIQKTIKANISAIENLEKRAVTFISEISRSYSKPICISFSGGKDSLATLILSIKAGVNGKMLFNDTGLELPETVSYVDEISNKLEVELIKADAGKAFWESLDIFGPPARDYRWCCKICKLIPILKTMKNEYPNGSLTLVGQRKYESLTRAKSQSIWKNKWLPDSINASPIMDWSALHVWLYIFWSRIDPNPLYQIGFDRLGCWLCPSCELAEFKLVKEVHPELWSEWENKLYEWAMKRGYSKDWVYMGLWRWIKIPGDQRKLAKEMKMEIEEVDSKRLPTRVIEVIGHSPCQGKYSIEAKLDVKINLDYVKDVLPIIGEVKYSKKLNILTVNMGGSNATLTSNGQVTIITEGEEKAEEYMTSILEAILRGMYCVKCNSCEYICPTQSIKIEDHPLINNEKCIKCGKCQSNCPIAEYMSKIMIWRIKQ